MSFFSSDVVRAEMAEIAEMQEKIYGNVFKFPFMSKDEKLDHLNLLEKFVEKQKILYTRISLSDDFEAIQMKEQILQSVAMFGITPEIGVNTVFDNMTKIISSLKEELDISDEI